MKFLNILFMAFLVMNATVAEAQQQRTCGTMAYLDQQKTSDPVGFEKRMNLIETQAQKWKKNHPNSKTDNVVITIPVVVHVVWKTAAQNISDAQIISQIDVLNEDYRRLNADTTLTPSGFVGVAADCEIEFCLALRDPSGNPTNGITRTLTTVTSFFNNNVKFDSLGGKDAWPNTDYLNIWICNLAGALGFATFPGEPAATDGVVCTYTSIGRPPDNPFPSVFNLGRTATHEIGHWFSLYHTFSGGCTGTTSTNCITLGDRVCDTPPTSSSNFGCPGTQNTCTETPADQNDMTSNFLDYTNDACMNIFTQGQKTRMTAVLNGSRLSIQSSQGCVSVIPPTTPVNDNICNADTLLFGIVYSSDNINGTAAPGELPGSCWEDSQVNNSVWFSFIATATGKITVTTIADSMTNSQLTLYVSDDNTCSGLLIPFVCNEDIDTAAGNYMSEIAFTGLTPGQIYFLQVDGFNGDQGSFGILLKDQISSGISEWNKANAVNIYPNPVNGFVNIDFNFRKTTSFELSVVDLVGKNVYSQHFNQGLNNHYQVDLSQLNSGIYFIKIENDNYNIIRKIIVHSVK